MSFISVQNSLEIVEFIPGKLPQGFAYVDTKNGQIISDLRYFTTQNFIGEKIDGYKRNVAILTNEAANAFNKAVDIFVNDGYKVIVYDAYRPQKAVTHFERWSEGESCNEQMRSYFLPLVDRRTVFELGYVARKSGHTRGSTIDLTIIKADELLTKAKPTKRHLSDGREFVFWNDNTVDMGTSFDFFDEASHPGSSLVTEEALRNRAYLKKVMETAGFKPLDEEWWHFTLINEPFPDLYFDFDVE